MANFACKVCCACGATDGIGDRKWCHQCMIGTLIANGGARTRLRVGGEHSHSKERDARA